MRPLDDTFADRVRETSLGLGGLVFLFLLAQPDLAVPVCLALGLGASLLVWRSAQLVGGALERRRWRARDVARLAGIH
ncbi:MAG: hypothetical protein HYU66_21565, partial [Armatimonadetes bacterium]|nr:hypothetical protein [Armatimonadota bacterium]